MGVDDGRALFVNHPGHSLCERGVKSWPAPEFDDGNAAVLEFRGPRAAFIEAAHPHRDLAMKPFDELQYKTFCTARMPTEDNLEDAKHGRIGGGYRGQSTARSGAGRTQRGRRASQRGRERPA